MTTWNTKRKKLLIILASILTIISAGLLAVPRLVDAARIKNIIITQLEAGLQRNVAAQAAEITTLTGLGVRLENVVISEDPRFGRAPFVRVQSLHVRPNLLTLILGRVALSSLHMEKPVINLVRNRAGVWNFESIGNAPSQEFHKEGKVQPADLEKSAPIAVSEFRLRDGILSVRDESSTSAMIETRYEHINLALNDLLTGGTGSFSLGVQLPGVDKGSLRAAGKFGPLDTAKLKKTPIDGSIEFSEIPFASLKSFLSPAAPGETDWQGTLSTETHFRGNIAEAFYLNGKTSFSDLKPRRADRESPEVKGEIQYTLKYQFDPGSIQIEKSQLRMPASTVNLAGTVKTQKDESLLDLKVDSTKTSVDDLLKVASVLGQGPPEGTKASGQGQFHLHITGTTKSPETAGQVNFFNSEINYPGLKEKILLSPVTLTFEHNWVSSNELQITVGDRTRLKAQLAAYFAPERFLSLKVNSQNPVQLADLIAIGSSFGMTLPQGYTMQNGTLDLQVGVKKSLGDKSDLNLSGSASLNGSQLKAPLLKVPLEIEKANLNFTGNSVNVSDLAASLKGSNINGKIQVVNFNAPVLIFGLNIDQLDLATLDSTVKSSEDSGGVIRAANASEPLARRPMEGNLYAANAKPSMPLPGPLAKLTVRESTVTIHKIKYDSLLLSDASSKIRLKNKIMELQDLQFRINQGTHTGQASFDFTRIQPHYIFSSKFKNLDANELLSQNTSLKNAIYGKLFLDTDLQGYGTGFDQAARNLKGRGKLSLINGRITSFDLTEQIARLGKFTGLYSGQAGTEINNLVATFQIMNGRVLTDRVKVQTPSATFRASGSFRLDKTIDYQIMAELPNNLSRRYDLAGQILNLASATFFKNEQGNIIVPLRMTGTVSNPTFALDTRVVQENLRDRLLREGPKGALETIQNIFKPKVPTGSSSQPKSNEAAPTDKPVTEPPQEKKKSSPLEELLKGVLDKAKEKSKSEKQK
jgi:uncharacterized protein involved in outer membrane biogenesis